ncbi:hypothetical protein, partial [Streptomyces sp. SM14]|uniref:hypothetical protein n=1 Tax=Streptomyces sp. SM14 TaxID=1736045 RepID=UPI000CD4B36F
QAEAVRVAREMAPAGLVLGALPEATAGAVAAAAAGAWAGGTLGLGCVVVGVAVERHDRVVLRAGRRLFRLTWAVVVALTVPAVCALFVELPAWAGQLMLASGPWGWGVQPLVAVTGGSAPLWIPAVLAQTALLAVAGVWCAREVGRIPGEVLRRRARVAESVAASVFSLDLRGAGRAIRAAHPGGGGVGVLWPLPRRRWLLVPWRDVTGLSRTPGRVVAAVSAVVFAVAVAARFAAGQPELASPAEGPVSAQPSVLPAVLALCALYFAAAQLVEPARVDSDDPRRAAQLPYSRAMLATWHAVVPVLVLIGCLLGAGAVGAALGGVWSPGWTVLLLSSPAMVGGALVSGYRGAMPVQVMVGVETAFGNTVPLQMALWYLRGPLGALLPSVPVLVLALDRDALGVSGVLLLPAAGAAGLLWARRTARALP